MQKIQFMWSVKRLRQVPLQYLFSISVLLLVSLFSFFFSVTTQYETAENTYRVEGTVSNMRRYDSYNRFGSRLVFVVEVNGEEYYIRFPNNRHSGYMLLEDFDFDTEGLEVELLVSCQSDGNRVVDFRCGEEVFYSIDSENRRIHGEKIASIFVGVCSLFVWFITFLIMTLSYRVLKICKANNNI